ncbi:MAG: hypothetical protein WCS92_03165 [Candidatus Babeliales bacterium]|jgi:uncharacterized membrane protein
MSSNKFFKKIINWLIIFLVIFLIGYIGYRAYDAVVQDITKRIRREVSSEIVDTINPFKWPGKIFGRRRKKKDGDEQAPKNLYYEIF